MEIEKYLWKYIFKSSSHFSPNKIPICVSVEKNGKGMMYTDKGMECEIMPWQEKKTQILAPKHWIICAWIYVMRGR